MARAPKSGLDYFPFDVNFLENRKIRRLVRKHGVVAVCVMMALLTSIYREHGYYLPWDEDVCFDLSELANTDIEVMHAIVADAIRAELFDAEMFKAHGILTSKEIQEQYLACTQKRKSVELKAEYKLIKSSANDSSGGISSPQTPLWGEETPEKGPEMPQRKEKEKEIERKEEEGGKHAGEFLEIDSRKIPRYCLNKQTHNCDGLLERLAQIHVTDVREVNAILKLSDYGRKGHAVWRIISHNNWPPRNKIKLPGKFILSQLNRQGAGV